MLLGLFKAIRAGGLGFEDVEDVALRFGGLQGSGFKL